MSDDGRQYAGHDGFWTQPQPHSPSHSQRALGQIQQERDGKSSRPQLATHVACPHVASPETAYVLPRSPSSPVITRRKTADEVGSYDPGELPPGQGIT